MSMIAVIHDKDFGYTRMKGLVWVAEGLTNSTMMNEEGGKKLAELLEKENLGTGLVVVNCQGMLSLGQHALRPVEAQLKNKPQQLLFMNSGDIKNELDMYFGGQNIDKSTDSSCGGITLIHSKNKRMSIEEAKKIVTSAVSLEKGFLGKLIGECFDEYSNGLRRMTSTPLLTNGIFNARALISNPEAFMWVCLSMVEQLERLIVDVKNPVPIMNTKLLAVSLRGSPFAAAVRLLSGLKLEIEVVDHMGPKHKILEEHSFAGSSRGVNYIYIGDFLIGSTELKIAQTYIYTKGCILKHAIVIGSALEPKAYGMSVNIIPLVKLEDCDIGVSLEYHFLEAPK